MKCSEYVKSKGIKSLALLSELSGVDTRTLQNWYVSRVFVFRSIVNECLKEVNKLPKSESVGFNEDGYYYGIIKEEYPNMPHKQAVMVGEFCGMDYIMEKWDSGDVIMNRLDPLYPRTIKIDEVGTVQGL